PRALHSFPTRRSSDLAVRGLVAYKGQRCFAACGQVGNRVGLDGYACGKKDVNGAQGTWRDAEDGVLGNNPIEQGSVDMTLALDLDRKSTRLNSSHLVI